MQGDKFIPACRYYVGDAILILHPHGEDSGALASSIVWLACACQGCPKKCVWRCAPVVRFAAPPLTGAGEPKTWLVRLLRRDCWPEWGVRLEHSRLRRPKPAVAPQVTPQVNPQVDDVEFW